MNRTILVDQLAELLRVGAVNRRLRAENERLKQWHDEQKSVADALAETAENAGREIERLTEEADRYLRQYDTAQAKIERLRTFLTRHHSGSPACGVCGWPED